VNMYNIGHSVIFLELVKEAQKGLGLKIQIHELEFRELVIFFPDRNNAKLFVTLDPKFSYR